MSAPNANNSAGGNAAQTQNGQLNTNNQATQPDPAATPPVQEALSPQFAALAKREKAMRAREVASKAREEQLTRDYEARLAASQREYEQNYRSKLAQDPWGEMIAAGLSAEQATQIILNQPTPQDQTLRQVQEQIKALQKQNEELLNQTKNSASESQKRAEAMVLKEIDLLVEGNEAFETITAMGAKQAVFDLIKDTLDNDGYMMTIEDAAQEVENYLIEQTLNYTKLKKVQAKLAPPAPDPVEQTKGAQQQVTRTQQQQPQTLSQNLRQQTSAKPLSAVERRQRAILVAQGLNPDGTPVKN